MISKTSSKESIYKIIERIQLLSEINCEGCQHFSASFKNHFCYYTDWIILCFTFYDQALSELEIQHSDELFEAVLNSNGTGNDLESKRFLF